VEARVGALGYDRHEIVYGIPASSALSTAASVMPTLPQVPAIPEISVAKKHDDSASAKIGVFAYHRESGRPVWQSGVATAHSTAKQMWLFGAGPFQRGTIYEGTQFAGSKLEIPVPWHRNRAGRRPIVSYMDEHHFGR